VMAQLHDVNDRLADIQRRQVGVVCLFACSHEITNGSMI
jgi:hypothetical protein